MKFKFQASVFDEEIKVQYQEQERWRQKELSVKHVRFVICSACQNNINNKYNDDNNGITI